MVFDIFPQGPLPIINNVLTLRNYRSSPTSIITLVITTYNAQKKRVLSEEEKRAISMQKMKKVITDKTEYGLRVMVMKANVFDHPLVQNRLYRVVCGVEPGKTFCTTMTQGFILLQWMDEGMIHLESPFDYVFLNVEVIRFMSQVDPGTSHGKVVVGRAKIPIPKVPGIEKRGVYDLIRVSEREEPKPEGRIMISMKLETMMIL